MPPFSLRPACDADIPFLISLRNETMREHYETSGAKFKTEDQIEKVIYKFDCAQIIIMDGKAIGVFKLDKKSTPWELVQLQIAPEYQGWGLGTKIIKDVLNEANEVGANIRLGVLKTNPAKRLYERFGFCEVEKKEHSYEMVYTSKQSDINERQKLNPHRLPGLT